MGSTIQGIKQDVTYVVFQCKVEEKHRSVNIYSMVNTKLEKLYNFLSILKPIVLNRYKWWLNHKGVSIHLNQNKRKLTKIVRRKLSNSRAVQMLLKFGWWFSTVVSSLSNQASLSSALAQTSGRRAIFSRDTHLLDNTSPGEPATSLTLK